MKNSMAVLLSVVLLLGFTPANNAGMAAVSLQDTPSPSRLTNRDVLDMVKNGLSQEVIIAKIRSSPAKFDTSPAALRELKSEGVPDTVLLAMVESPATPGEGRPQAG